VHGTPSYRVKWPDDRDIESSGNEERQLERESAEGMIGIRRTGTSLASRYFTRLISCLYASSYHNRPGAPNSQQVCLVRVQFFFSSFYSSARFSLSFMVTKVGWELTSSGLEHRDGGLFFIAQQRLLRYMFFFFSLWFTGSQPPWNYLQLPSPRPCWFSFAQMFVFNTSDEGISQLRRITEPLLIILLLKALFFFQSSFHISAQ
jgi:hypothetical protein